MTADALYRRCEYLYDWLQRAFEGVAEIGLWTPQEWKEQVDLTAAEDPAHYPFGFLPPRYLEECNEWRIGVCPQLIAQSMGSIDEEWEQQYLMGWVLHLLNHIIHYSEPPDQIEAIVEDAIGRTAEGCLKIMTLVQLDWLSQLEKAHEN